MEYTDEFQVWFDNLTEEEQESIDAAVEKLEELGPGLGRPLVGKIETSRYPNMKELRPLGGNIRILFLFDPRRVAILLIGGDKTHRWQRWYKEMIPVADRLCDKHFEQIGQKGRR